MFPKTLSALRDQEDRSWAVVDALLEEITPGKHGEYDRCSAWLAEQGFEVTSRYLSDMRLTGTKFPAQSREFRVPFRLYMEAAQNYSKWSSELMKQAEKEHWTLRQFSKELTGRAWADDTVEAAKRALKDEVTRREVLADQQVVDAIVNDEDAQSVVAAASNKLFDRIESGATRDVARFEGEHHEAIENTDFHKGLLELGKMIESAKRGLHYHEGVQFSEQRSAATLADIEKLEKMLGMWRALVMSGETFAAELEALLNAN